jgi:LPS export ABC transporter protein LptC
MKLVLMLSALGSLLLLWITAVPTPSTGSVFQRQQFPQEYLQHFSVTLFASQGSPAEILSAETWSYRPEHKSSYLNAPRLTLYKPQGIQWHISADQGQTLQFTLGQIEQIDLSGHVCIERSPSQTTPFVRLETTELRYQPQQHYAETAQFVKMTKPGLEITGQGLRAFLETNAVEILHHVQTVYKPTA